MGHAMTPTPAFPFIPGLVESAGHLQDVLLKGRFPDLDKEVSSDDEAVARFEEARTWAMSVSNAFGASASREVGHEVPSPKPLLTWFRGSARQQANASPRVDRAADVLGELPEEFLKCRADAILTMSGMGVTRGSVQRPSVNREVIAIGVASWPTIQEDLHLLRIMAVVQGMQLVSLVRGRISALRQALLPEIEKIEDLPKNCIRACVRMAGNTREVELSFVEADFLRRLAADGKARVLRNAKMNVVRVIPELSPWLEPDRKEPRGQSEGVFKIPEELQPCIRLGPEQKVTEAVTDLDGRKGL
jgi:hypothetical protein